MQLSEENQDGLLEQLTIFADAPYYPFRFYAILIEQTGRSIKGHPS